MPDGPPISVGVVGGGLVAQVVHLPVLRSLSEKFTLAVVAEPSPTVRAALAGRYQPVRATHDWRQVLDAEIEAVIIASPNPTHAEIALAAIERGMHVLVEKPMCLTIQQAHDLIAARDRVGVVLQVGYMKRYDETYQRLIEDVSRTGPLVRYIDAVTYDPGLLGMLPPGTVVHADDLPGGLVSELGEASISQGHEATGLTTHADAAVYSGVYAGALIHDVNAIGGVLETVDDRLPSSAAGSTYWAGGRAASMTWTSAAGVPCSTTWLELPEVRVFTETLRVHCTDVVYEIGFGAPYAPLGRTRTTLAISGRGGERRELSSSLTSDAYERELHYFYASVRNEVPTLTPAEQALADQALLADAFRLGLAPTGEAARATAAGSPA